MLTELDNYDWESAFSYGAGFSRDDVKEIYGVDEGEPDEKSWMIYGLLNDGRYFYLEAGCDLTGWDCQASGWSSVNSSKDELIRMGMTDEARERFGLECRN